MQFDPTNGLVRSLRWGEVELLRGVYVAVRDQNWNTVTPQISEMQISQTADKVDIRFVADCRRDEIDFRWEGRIQLSGSGNLSYSFGGRANSTFLRNRIGFCVLHSPECAGKTCRVDHADGSERDTVFPTEISPDQPIRNLQAIKHSTHGISVAVELHGETFEMEDQRNWTDASFKTYCTPLSNPFPVNVQEGDVVEQEVVVRIEIPKTPTGSNECSPNHVGERIEIARISGDPVKLPRIGLQGSLQSLDQADTSVLKNLGLNHLRFDLLFDSDLASNLDAAKRQTEAIGVEMELALFINSSDQSFDVLAAYANRICRILVFDNHGGTPLADVSTALLSRLRKSLPETSLGSGTNRYFAEFNRSRPDGALWDAVCWSINPQVHAFDDLSLIETLEMQGVTVNSARSFLGDVAIVVTPVTLRPRFNPDAAVDAACQIAQPGADAIDHRQETLFAAGWTLASIKNLAESGVSSVTYYELIGPRGIMRSAVDAAVAGSGSGDSAGAVEVFPLFHVLADVLEYSHGHVCKIQSSDPLNATAICLKHAERERIVVANHTPRTIAVTVPLQNGQWSKRSLDSTTVRFAATDPDLFRQTRDFFEPGGNDFELTLLPHAVITLDRNGGRNA